MSETLQGNIPVKTLKQGGVGEQKGAEGEAGEATVAQMVERERDK
jgi:hypothetical protein